MTLQIIKYRNLISELVVRDIKKKYRRSVLGILWSILNPLLMMIITAMVFSTLFRFNVHNYILYLLCGQMLFGFYAESTNFAMGSILENGSLIKKIYVPKYLFPVSRVLSSAVNLTFTFPALLAIMIYTGAPFNWHTIFCLVPLALLLIFSAGVGFFLSTASVYFRDMFHLYGVFITALNYATPIFYPENIVPQKYHFLLDLNPLYYYLKAFRTIIVDGQLPSLHLLGICTILAFASLALGFLFFYRKQTHFILYI